MLIKLYGLKDTVTGVDDVVLSASNHDELKRHIKYAILQKNSIFIKDVKDKQIFYVGTKDTSTSIITGTQPVLIYQLQEIFDELSDEIALAQARKEASERKAKEIVKEENNSHE